MQDGIMFHITYSCTVTSHVLLTFNFPRCSYKVDLQDEKITKNNYRAGNIASEPERHKGIWNRATLVCHNSGFVLSVLDPFFPWREVASKNLEKVASRRIL